MKQREWQEKGLGPCRRVSGKNSVTEREWGSREAKMREDQEPEEREVRGVRHQTGTDKQGGTGGGQELWDREEEDLSVLFSIYLFIFLRQRSNVVPVWPPIHHYCVAELEPLSLLLLVLRLL